MKKYKVFISEAAKQDFIHASDYIKNHLMNPAAADSLLEEASYKLEQLSSFPQKYKLTEDSLLASWGIRYLSIKNYLAFFIINDTSHTVYILRFLFGKRNWTSILKKDFLSHGSFPF